MNCRSCGTGLPSGVGFCTSCGSPAPYNTTGPGTPQSSSYAETIAAPPPYSVTPPTAYGAPNPYAPPQTPQAPYPPADYGSSPYGVPGTPPPSPYGTPPPYGAPGTPPAYGTPGTPPPYGAPGTPPAYGYNNAAGYPPMGVPGSYAPPQPPKRKSKVGLILGIIALVLVVVCGGSIFALYNAGKHVVSTARTSISATSTSIFATSTAILATPTTSTNNGGGSGNSPSGQAIDTAASAIVSNLQAANSIDSNSNAVGVSSTFKVNQKFDLIIDVNSAGQDGYIESKLYLNNQLLPDQPAILHHHAQYTVAYFPTMYANTGDAANEMYWCTKADCSDAKLAQVITFTIV
jgi:hypothetical protein